MSLTDDWKAGKLEDGLYYILLENGKTPISELETWYRTNIEESKEYYETEQAFYGYSDNMISEVLAPVPTYDEYKAMQEQIADASKKVEELEDQIADLEEANKQLVKDTGYGWHTAGIESDKNDKLRGLLRECLAHLSLGEIGTSVTPINILIDRINAALGESEEQ